MCCSRAENPRHCAHWRGARDSGAYSVGVAGPTPRDGVRRGEESLALKFPGIAFTRAGRGSEKVAAARRRDAALMQLGPTLVHRAASAIEELLPGVIRGEKAFRRTRERRDSLALTLRLLGVACLPSRRTRLWVSQTYGNALLARAQSACFASRLGGGGGGGGGGNGASGGVGGGRGRLRRRPVSVCREMCYPQRRRGTERDKRATLTV